MPQHSSMVQRERSSVVTATLSTLVTAPSLSTRVGWTPRQSWAGRGRLTRVPGALARCLKRRNVQPRWDPSTATASPA